jgi:chromatin assembly factor 1 subunit B
MPGVPRRESESEREDGAPGGKKRELPTVSEVQEGRQGKRRRIAPTPVNVDNDIAIASTEENTPTTTQAPSQK